MLTELLIAARGLHKCSERLSAKDPRARWKTTQKPRAAQETAREYNYLYSPVEKTILTVPDRDLQRYYHRHQPVLQA